MNIPSISEYLEALSFDPEIFAKYNTFVPVRNLSGEIRFSTVSLLLRAKGYTDAPIKYLERLKKHAGVADAMFEGFLHSHVVDPQYLYTDDFAGFFANRKEKILQRIEKAMGKVVMREQMADTGEVFTDDVAEIDGCDY